MASLIYTAITSIDGFVEDADGRFEWARPDEEVLAFINDLERPIATYLYGRKMYETMLYWETVTADPSQSRAVHDFADLWRAAHKIVYSSTLDTVGGARTRLERSFDPDDVRRIKTQSVGPVSIGGATLAARALDENLVDVIRLVVHPVIIGAGTPALAVANRREVELVDERTFAGGAQYLAYRMTSSS